MTDRQLIEIGAQELAARYGFGSLKVMRQRDLEYLCRRIEESSGILISLSTIKRILNGQYNRLPQVATLNAIGICLGYADWQSFKTAKLAEAVETAATAEAGPSVKVKAAAEPVRFRKVAKIIGAGTAALLLVVILSWGYFLRSPAMGDNTAIFTVRKTTQNAVPNTVVFQYDIDRVSGDSFFIQQSWDKNRRVRVYKKTYTLTDIYFEPGYHVAKLFANDRIVKTIGVSIPTDRWFLYCKESFARGLPAYIHTDSPVRRGILGLDRQVLVDNKIDPQKPHVYLQAYFPTVIGADADNFRLTARVRLTEVCNTACPFIMTEVYCQRSFMYCMFTMPGCTGGISAQFGDRVVDGKNNDLSALAIDIHQWHDLELRVRQRQVTVLIDGKAVMTKEYTASSGLITGLGFHSNGLCEADSIRLAGLDGKTVYPQ
jgi:hypothetical protein